MRRSPTDLGTYLLAVTGQPARLTPAAVAAQDRLPLFVRDRYRLGHLDLFGLDVVLAEEVEGAEQLAPRAYALQLAAISEAAAMPAVLVPQPLTSATRNRLVQARIPFIVPGTQMFLPMLLVDLRERAKHVPSPPTPKLSTVAQLIVLYHLERQPLDRCTLREVAALLGYSAMMITKAKDELLAAGLCTTRQAGRAVHLAFAADGKALWHLALPRMRSPVGRTYAGTETGPPHGNGSGTTRALPLAGITALSRQTGLGDDDVPSYAGRDTSLATALRAGELRLADTVDDAAAFIEAWRYDPAILAAGGLVDPLSLYLSLRDSADDRVQQALETLLGERQW